MGIPSTLAGLIGFVVAVIFIIGMAATDIFPDNSRAIQNSNADLTHALNSTMNITQSEPGLLSSLLAVPSFLGVIIAFIVLMVQYVLLFVGIATILPTEFYLLFALIVIGSIVAIVKLVFMSGD
jgi:hypothetical protein